MSGKSSKPQFTAVPIRQGKAVPTLAFCCCCFFFLFALLLRLSLTVSTRSAALKVAAADGTAECATYQRCRGSLGRSVCWCLGPWTGFTLVG